MNEMVKRFIVAGALLCCCIWVTAQQRIELHSPKQQHTQAYLYDDKNNFLLTLPLTFNITDRNILIMMAGNDVRLADDYTVWMFSEEMKLADLMNNNRNVNAKQSFQRQNKDFKTVLAPHRQISLFREFDDGYETIKKNALPAFFEIKNPPSNQPITFFLQFYVAKIEFKTSYFFISKCNPIEVQLVIK